MRLDAFLDAQAQRIRQRLAQPLEAEALQRIRAREGEPPASVVQAPHGTRARYLAGCTCLDCRAANTRYSSEHRQRQRVAKNLEAVRKYLASLHPEYGVPRSALCRQCHNSPRVDGRSRCEECEQVRAQARANRRAA